MINRYSSTYGVRYATELLQFYSIGYNMTYFIFLIMNIFRVEEVEHEFM